jgi:hypothetical protein
MAYRILISILFVMNLSAIDNKEVGLMSKRLFALMNKAYAHFTGKTFKMVLNLPEEPFDFSE